MRARKAYFGVLIAALVGSFFIQDSVEAVTPREDHLRFQIGTYLNAERKARGLSELPFDAQLQQSAQRWSDRNRSVNCQDTCHSTDADSEILAWGGPDSRSGAIVDAFMRSRAHRNVILHPRSVGMGVGFACATSGNVFVTVQYRGARKPVPDTPEPPIVTPTSAGTSCDAPDQAPPSPPPSASVAPQPARPTQSGSAAESRRTVATAPPPPSTQPTAPTTTPPNVTAAPAPTTTTSTLLPPTTRPPTTTTTTEPRPRRTTTTMGPPIEFDSDIDLGTPGLATAAPPRVNVELVANVIRSVLVAGLVAPFVIRRRRRLASV